jgi:glucose-1-phosphate thymidylyltransferase
VYLYPNDACKVAAGLDQSDRGEYEITDLNNWYIKQGRMQVVLQYDAPAWFDCGTPDSLLEASSYVQAYQKRTGLPIGSPDWWAFQNKWINQKHMIDLCKAMPPSAYRDRVEGAI